MQRLRSLSDALYQRAQSAADGYRAAQPFPHAVLDDLFPEALLDEVLDAFPEPGASIDWRVGDARHQRAKKGSADVWNLPEPIVDFLNDLNSAVFLEFLEKLTGMDNLISDPYFVGGGIHQIETGGFLKIHRDYLKHRRFHLPRRVNVLIYLNRDWPEEFGGHLELWDAGLERCQDRILPVFNRTVVFNTSEDSYHGHPDPLRCPPERRRKSIALYYYGTNPPPTELTPEVVEEYDTPWKARPGETLEG